MIMDDEMKELQETFASAIGAMRQGECRRGFELWNAVWDDDGGFSPSHGRYFEMTGSENTANILMGGGSPEWAAMSSLMQEKEFLTAFHAFNAGSVYDAGMAFGHFDSFLVLTLVVWQRCLLTTYNNL